MPICRCVSGIVAGLPFAGGGAGIAVSTFTTWPSGSSGDATRGSTGGGLFMVN